MQLYLEEDEKGGGTGNDLELSIASFHPFPSAAGKSAPEQAVH